MEKLTKLPLNQVVKQKIDLQKELNALTAEFDEKKKAISAKMFDLQRLEELAYNDHDINKIQVAESVINCRGDITAWVDGASLVDRAIADIALGCKNLRERYFGNKRYDGYYQNSNHTYHMGPSHGYIVDEIGLKQEFRHGNLTDEEKDACLYYLINYNKIKSQKV